jgi:hypothetical protein
VSSASLILTDGGVALSERKAGGAQGRTKVLAASSRCRIKGNAL